MRLSVEMKLSGESPFMLDANYRRNIIALIKHAFKSYEGGHELYFKYWGLYNSGMTKPFTFALYFHNPRIILSEDNASLEFDSNSLKLYITSIDDDFLSILHKGLSKIDNSYSPFKYPVESMNVLVKDGKSIDTDYADFKIMSPVVVREMLVRGYTKRKVGYLALGNPRYEITLAHSIRNLCRQYLPDGDTSIHTDDINIDTSGCKFLFVHHYSEVIPAVRGRISIKAKREVLKCIYNAGLGARRGQGFGMVDVIKSA